MPDTTAINPFKNGKGKTNRRLSCSHESKANITPNAPSKFQKIFLM